MIVYRSAVVADRWVLEPGVEEIVRDALSDISDRVVAEIFGQGVDFVNEDGVFDVRVRGLKVQDRFRQAADGLHVVVYGVEDPDHGADAAEDPVGVEFGVEVVDLAGHVPDLEFHEGALGEI